MQREKKFKQPDRQASKIILLKRDNQLDVARALIMIYIVCIIHGMYWYGAGNAFLRSALLFEMPLIFYISGASYSLTRPKKTLETILNRFKRIFLPYYIYVIIWLFILFVWGRTEYLSYGHCWKTIIGLSFEQAPAQYHIWFILPYMLISCSLPVQKALLNKISPVKYLAINVAVFLLACTFTLHDILLYVLCYNFFFILGYVSYRQWNINRWVLIIVGLFLVLLSLFYKGELAHMQMCKFPPNINFLTFGLGWLGICGGLMPLVSFKCNSVLRVWCRHGYTIYLYQTIPFVLYGCLPICEGKVWLHEHPLLGLIILPVFIFVANTILCLVLNFLRCGIFSFLGHYFGAQETETKGKKA